MSAALHSLMHDDPRPRAVSAPLGGLLAFLVVGGAGAVAFVLLSTAMIGLDTGFAAWTVNAACYAALVGPVYLLHRRYSFQSSAAHSQALPRYMAVQAMALLLAAAFSHIVHGMLSVPTLIASVVVIGLTSAVNFMVLRSWTFARSRRTLPAAA